MDMRGATNKQLFTIATYEKCDLTHKYAAARRLQDRRKPAVETKAKAVPKREKL